MEVWRGLSFGV
jgi:phenylalanyl-tRNA synthetase beta chain